MSGSVTHERIVQVNATHDGTLRLSLEVQSHIVLENLQSLQYQTILLCKIFNADVFWKIHCAHP